MLAISKEKQSPHPRPALASGPSRLSKPQNMRPSWIIHALLLPTFFNPMLGATVSQIMRRMEWQEALKESKRSAAR